MNELQGRYYPVSIQGQKFVPVGQMNLSGYTSYEKAWTALKKYYDFDSLAPPYAIVYVAGTFDEVSIPQPSVKLDSKRVDYSALRS